MTGSVNQTRPQPAMCVLRGRVDGFMCMLYAYVGEGVEPPSLTCKELRDIHHFSCFNLLFHIYKYQ